MTERIIPLDKSVIVAADIKFSKLTELIEDTYLTEGIGGYKIGLTLALEKGLPGAVGKIKNKTNLPIIYDHQKGGNDIPELGFKFAKVSKDSGVDAVILFPFVGPKSESDWIHACQDAGLGVIVGAHMTHKDFLKSQGGFIQDNIPDKIFTIAAENGVRDFVIPGNNVLLVRHYKELFDSLLGKDNFTLYAPGFITQGGVISEFANVAGDKWHAIVGRDIYNAPDIRSAAREITRKIK